MELLGNESKENLHIAARFCIFADDMRPTKDYIEKKYKELNALCFGGELPEVPVQMSRARTFLGQLGFKRRRRLLRGWENYDFVLRISVRTDLPEDEVIDTLLHEMIHLSIASRQVKDTSTHGRLFRQMMADINKRYGRHITISHRKTKDEQELDTQRRTHLICVSTFSTGERGITIAAKSRLFSLWDLMPGFPEVTETKWFLSYDPYFNRFPRALTPKIYRIPAEELEEHLRDASPLMRQSGRIVVMKRSEETLPLLR